MLSPLQQLYRHRMLVYILVTREIKARYRGTVLGFLWSFVNPLALMGIYSLVFSVYLRFDMENYPSFLLCGILPWAAFASSLAEATPSILTNGSLVKQVYLPTQVMPLIYVVSNLIHYLLSLPILLLFLYVSGVDLTVNLAFLPFVLSVQLVFTYALALTTSSLAVQFRDLLHVVPNVLLFWFFLSPVFYPASTVPERFRPLLGVNPVATLMISYQDICFYGRPPTMMNELLILAVGSVVFLVAALGFFERRKDLLVEEL